MKDFTKVPAGRYLSDSDWTGERFRRDFLAPALEAADKEKQQRKLRAMRAR